MFLSRGSSTGITDSALAGTGNVGVGSEGKSAGKSPHLGSWDSLASGMVPARPSASPQAGGTSSQKAPWEKKSQNPHRNKGFLPNLGQSYTEEPMGMLSGEQTAPKSHSLVPNSCGGWERGPGAAAPWSPIHSQPAAFPGIPISSGIRGCCPYGHRDVPVRDNSILAQPAVPHSMDSLPPSPPGWELKSSCHGK